MVHDAKVLRTATCPFFAVFRSLFAVGPVYRHFPDFRPLDTPQKIDPSSQSSWPETCWIFHEPCNNPGLEMQQECLRTLTVDFQLERQPLLGIASIHANGISQTCRHTHRRATNIHRQRLCPTSRTPGESQVTRIRCAGWKARLEPLLQAVKSEAKQQWQQNGPRGCKNGEGSKTPVTSQETLGCEEATCK